MGVCTQNTALLFWDASTNFNYEARFDLLPYTKESQDKIWYVDFLNYWMTADGKGILYLWDLIDMELIRKVKVRPGNAIPDINVIDLKSIDHLKLLIVATNDKVLTVYEAATMKSLLTVSLDLGGYNTMEYFESYQVLLVAGFENTVKVFTFTPDHCELNAVGRLVGHVSVITSVKAIDGTAMILTADDKGIAKVWDIRKLVCVQTLTLANKVNVFHILHLKDVDKVTFIGDRMTCLEFEHGETKTAEKVVPIGCDINETTSEIFICTRTEVRVLDIQTGRVKSIFVNLIEKEVTDEITSFKMLQRKNCFILGNIHGVVNIYNSTTSEIVRRSHPHTHSVTGVKLDNMNGMILTTSLDASARLQIEKDMVAEKLTKAEDSNEREEFFRKPILFEGEGKVSFEKYKREVLKNLTDITSQTKSMVAAVHQSLEDDDQTLNIEVIRGLDNCNDDKEISLVELSVYHNLIVMAGNDHVVYLYSYEYMKPVAKINLEPDAEVSFLGFINGFAKLVIADTAGRLFFFGVSFKSSYQLIIEYDMVMRVDSMVLPGVSKRNLSGFINHGIVDVTFLDDQSRAENSPKKHDKVEEKLRLRHNLIGNSTQNTDLFLGETSGVICRVDLGGYLDDEPALGPSWETPNYNAFRKVYESFESSSIHVSSNSHNVKMMIPRLKADSLPGLQIKCFQVARDSLTSLVLYTAPRRLLLLTSLDSTFKVFTVTGEMICHLNLNHPLPLIWNLKQESLSNIKGQVAFALKSIELMNRRYSKPEDLKLLNLKAVLDYLATGTDNKTFSMTSIDQVASRKPSLVRAEISRGHTRGTSIAGGLLEMATPTNVAQKPTKISFEKQSEKPSGTAQSLEQLDQTVYLMKDIYTPKDLIYDKILAENRDEIQGPNLKQLDSMRRAKIIRKMTNQIDEVDPAIFEEAKHKVVKEQQKKYRAAQTFLGRPEYGESKARHQNETHTIIHSLEDKFSELDQGVRASKFALPAEEASQGSFPRINQSSKRISVRPSQVQRRSKWEKDHTSIKEYINNARNSILRMNIPTTEVSAISISKANRATDVFEYATERQLIPESYSISKIKGSKILSEGEEASTAHNTSLQKGHVERREEQQKFHLMLKQLDRKAFLAKHRIGSTFATQRTADHEETRFLSRANESSIVSMRERSALFASVSLPRLK